MLSVCDLVKVTHSLEKSNKKDTFPPRTEPGKHTLKKLRPCAGGAGAQGDQDAEIYPDRTILQEDARPLCSQQHNPQQPRHGDTLDVHRPMNGSRRGAYIQRDITQP